MLGLSFFSSILCFLQLQQLGQSYTAPWGGRSSGSFIRKQTRHIVSSPPYVSSRYFDKDTKLQSTVASSSSSSSVTGTQLRGEDSIKMLLQDFTKIYSNQTVDVVVKSMVDRKKGSSVILDENDNLAGKS